jgi:hypothetical protein
MSNVPIQTAGVTTGSRWIHGKLLAVEVFHNLLQGSISIGNPPTLAIIKTPMNVPLDRPCADEAPDTSSLTDYDLQHTP